MYVCTYPSIHLSIYLSITVFAIFNTTPYLVSSLRKTIQTIAFLGWLHHQHLPPKTSSPKTHLIVVPGSTLGNWRNELDRFCPSLRVVVYHGSPKEKQRVKRLLKKAMLLPPSGSSDITSRGHKQRNAVAPSDEIHIVLATYTMFERESGSEDRSLLKKINFEYLVLDGRICVCMGAMFKREGTNRIVYCIVLHCWCLCGVYMYTFWIEAHCIKNASSSRYYHLRSLRTRRRLLLSGTPVQNDVTELLALLGFLMPQVLFCERGGGYRGQYSVSGRLFLLGNLMSGA